MSFRSTASGRIGRRVAAALGALVAGTALALSAAVPASAAPNIDPNATGSITVHKFAEPTTPTGLPNNGTAVDTTGLTPLAGVSFSVQQVNVDLTDSAAWQGLENYTVAQAQANLTGSATVQQTGADGVTAFTSLPVGLYLVTETDPGANNVTFHGDPFLVTIPLALNNDWLYDVHVYPKNTVQGIEKAIDDSAAHVLGDTVTFTLTSQVPALPATTALTAFGITDTLDSRLSYTDATVTVAGLTLDAADYTIGATGQDFALTFTPAGLTKLRTVQGADVTVTLNTTVTTIGDGTIENTAQVYVNDPADAFDSNTVSTQWGALQVIKHAEGDTAKLLAGAEFELYALDAAGARIAGPLTDVTDGDTIFTTAADGTFTVEGLKIGDYELVETKAPIGYQLDSTPIAVTITAGSIAEALVQQVGNTQVPAFMLPLTGGAGVATFTIVGLLILGAGVLLAVIVKRRRATV